MLFHPYEPGINGANQAGFVRYCFANSRHIIDEPLDFQCRKVWLNRQT